MAKQTAERDKGTVILVPSNAAAKPWEDVATIANTNDVTTYVKELQERTSSGPFVFVNRYDGIDLPGDACRLLIMSGLSYGGNEYESYRAAVFMDTTLINAEVMQRIEQGIGRGARGAGDYCVVILMGFSATTRSPRPPSVL